VDFDGNEPWYPLGSSYFDEPIWQILESETLELGAYSNDFALGPVAQENNFLESESGASIMTMTNAFEDGDYAFEIMVDSEEEDSHEEDDVFDSTSEEESTDDEHGFESEDEDEDEDEDSDIELSDDEDDFESDEEDEVAHIPVVDLMWISGPYIFDPVPVIYFEEPILEDNWPSFAWQSAFDQIDEN
jgi:hypothetical protein